jgi:hypothetical protein
LTISSVLSIHLTLGERTKQIQYQSAHQVVPETCIECSAQAPPIAKEDLFVESKPQSNYKRIFTPSPYTAVKRQVEVPTPTILALKQ